MNHTRRLILAGAVALLLVAVPVATAAAPTVTITQWSHTGTIAASPDTCPFPVVVHSQGLYRESVYSEGRDVTTLSDFHITLTNPANGKSLSSAFAGPLIVQPNGDGTVTVTVNGNDELFAAPGAGLVFGDVGRLVYIADEGSPGIPLVILQSTGHQDASPFPAVCPALA
jgi:hypothetical protein